MERKKLNVACVTWAKNETGFLQFWFRYYASLFGESHCYVIDHNSEHYRPQDVLDSQEVNIMRLPMDKSRNYVPGDAHEFDRERFQFLTRYVQALLRYYDIVIVNDTDEIYHPDPRKYASLKDYLETSPTQRNLAGVGIEIFHDFEGGEADFDFLGSLFAQRQNYIYRMHHSKPMIIRQPTELKGHGVTAPFDLDANLYLVHLKYVDKKSMEERQDFLHSLYQNNTVTGQTRWRLNREEIVEELKSFAKLPHKPGFRHHPEFEQLLDKTDVPDVFLVNGRPIYYPSYELTKSVPRGSFRDLLKHRFRFDAAYAKTGV